MTEPRGGAGMPERYAEPLTSGRAREPFGERSGLAPLSLCECFDICVIGYIMWVIYSKLKRITTVYVHNVIVLYINLVTTV